MAIQWGAYAGYVRLGIDITGSGGTYIIKLYAGWNGGVAFSNTLTRGGSWAGSMAVSMNSAWGSSGTRDLYGVQQSFTGTRTYTASFPTPWGTASVSRSITYTPPPAPSVPKPGVPSNFKITRTGDTTATLSFTKGSNAASTQITASNPDKAWYNLANPTGTSQAVTGLKVNTRWGFNLYSKNSTGNSAVIGPYYMYTKPATPSAPTLADGGKLTWTLPSLFKHGVEVQRTNDAGATVTTTEIEAVTSWSDPVVVQPMTQYRVRVWVGPSHDTVKTYSDWSAWSQAAYIGSYKPPVISTLKAQRCNSAGQLSELGTYLRVTSTGTATSVKLPATGLPEGKLTLTGDTLVVEEVAGVRPTNLQETPLAYEVGANDLRVVYDSETGAVYAAGMNEEVVGGTPGQLVESNWLTRVVKWRKKGASAWSTSTITTEGLPNNWSHAVTIGAGQIAPTDSYEVQYTALDNYSPLVSATVTVATSQVALSIAEKGIGVGKTWQQGALDVEGDAHVSGLIHGGFLTGSVTIAGKGTPGNTASVTFPSGSFTTPPLVFVSKSSGGVAKSSTHVTNVTATGFTLGWYTGDGSNISADSGQLIAWIAIPQ